VKYHRSANSSHDHHNRDRKTPLTLYVAMKVPAATRSRTLVDSLFNLGCVFHMTVFCPDLGNGVCNHFTLNGVICPSKMLSGLFTVAAANNIDYNPSATTTKDCFHGCHCS